MAHNLPRRRYLMHLANQVQANPDYLIVKEIFKPSGPANDPIWVVELNFNGLTSKGEAGSKQEARDDASRQALLIMGYELEDVPLYEN